MAPQLFPQVVARTSSLAVPVTAVASVVAPVASIVPAAVPTAGAGLGIQTLPALPSLTVPTGTAISITIPTTVGLAQTAIVSSLAALPENANIPGLASVLEILDGLPLPTEALPGSLPLSALPSNIVSILPADLPLSLPLSAPLSALPTGIIASLPANLPADLPLSALPIQLPELPLGLPLVPVDSVSPVLRLLETLGETLISQLASQLSGIVATIASAAAGLPLSGLPVSPLTGVSSLLPLNSLTRVKQTSEEAATEKRQLGNLLGGLTGGSSGAGGALSGVTGLLGNLGAVTGVLSGLTGGVAGGANPLAILGNVPVVGGLVNGLTGGAGGLLNNVPVVGGLLGGATSGNPLSAVTGLLGGLTLTGGPLSAVTGVLGNLGLGSIVLNVVESLPIPVNLVSIIDGIRQAAIAPVTSLLDALQLSEVANILAITNLLAVNNVGQLGSLGVLTNLPAVQTAVQSLNTDDLLTVLDILNTDTGLAKRQLGGLGSLLSSPLEFVKIVQSIVPLVTNPAAAVAFLILQQLNIGGLGDLTSTLSGVTGGLTSALPVKA